ncbi:MAG TPA: hypothetical protein ENI95_06305 [Chloroflexi bacterium]|nr:hypothetical protein [Chloroflexota bacterium]
MANAVDEPIGRVLRASTQGFSAGARVHQIDTLAFGMLVRAQPRNEEAQGAVYGLLYDIHIDDDPLVRELVLADTTSEEMIRDQHYHRLVPVEMSILSIGFRAYDGQIRHALPPRPPLSLDPVYVCSSEEIREVTSRFDYFRLVLTSQVPSEQLLAANLLIAAGTLPENEQYDFLVRAGREVARLLGGDMARLDNLLRLIYPSTQ